MSILLRILSSIFILNTAIYAISTKVNSDITYSFEKEAGAVAQKYDLSNIELYINTKTTLNDYFNLNSKILLESNYYHSGKDDNYSDIDIENLYLQAINENISIDIGKVTLDGPLSDNPYGIGAKATAYAGIDTRFYGNLFLDNSIENSSDFKIAQASMTSNLNDYFNFEFWVAQMNLNKFHNFTFGINPTKDINFTMMHSWASYENTSSLIDKPSLTKLLLDVNYAYSNIKLSLGTTTRENNYVTLDKSTDAKANYSLWQLDLKDKADSYIVGVDVSLRVYPNVDLRGAVARGLVSNFNEADEYLGEISYKYKKDLSISAKASKYIQSYTIVNQITALPEKHYNNFYKGLIELTYKF